MKTKFVKETDRKGTYIIEGSSDGRFFNIKRFICQVQKQVQMVWKDFDSHR